METSGLTRETLSKLKAFFPEISISWKPIAVSKKTGKALAAAYVDNRAVMDRLDEVCGPENWWNEYRPGPDGGVVCGITINTENGPITKWDGAEATDIEPVKGSLSTSMRRAAVQWGLGRYIYQIPQQWVPIDQNKRFTKDPKVPKEFLPPRPRSTPAKKTPSKEVIGTEGADRLCEFAETQGYDAVDMLAAMPLALHGMEFQDGDGLETLTDMEARGLSAYMKQHPRYDQMHQTEEEA